MYPAGSVARSKRLAGVLSLLKKGLPMSSFQLSHPSPVRVAIVGAGIAGAACAASLRDAGLAVTLFDKSRGAGGRMSTRRVQADGHAWQFDHGAQHIQARHPRFKAALRRAAQAGVLLPWQPRVHAAWPAPTRRESWVPAGQMPALARHLIGDAALHLEWPVTRLERTRAGWMVVGAEGRREGPFDHLVLALPPAQAAPLVAGHQDAWAEQLGAWPMLPCWTLMAATQAVDWPWDACEPDAGSSPLAWLARNDRKPGREAPADHALWVAQASAAWSAEHLDASPAAVQTALSQALAALLPAGVKPQWAYRAVHRWRYAAPAAVPAAATEPCWWDAGLGLAVCGDFLGGPSAGGVESAWRSGDEAADTLLAALDLDAAPAPARVLPRVGQPQPLADLLAA
jgi:predicted NAD/FAD-dependent oxidoreductase